MSERGGRGAIVTIVERTTGFLLMEKLTKGKNAEGLADAVIRMMLPYKECVHTITADNGTAFARHEKIADKLDARFFLAHPYSSWERGLSEYTNRLVRQYIPKNMDFCLLDGQDVKQIQYKINKGPRKKIGFDNPKRRFFRALK